MPGTEAELRVTQALQYMEENPGSKFATVARQFSISRKTLQRRSQGVSARIGYPTQNTKLSQEEEVALYRYIDRLDNTNFAIHPEFVTNAANHILRERSSTSLSSTPETIGKAWTTRFLQRHGYFKRLQKKLDSNRQASEDIPRVTHYFKQLKHTIERFGIPPEDIWNMDETGFRIGIGKDQLVVTKRKRAHLFSMPENREAATAIKAISASSKFIPAFLILSGVKHISQWYKQPELEDATVIALSPTGYSNDEISLAWIKHFHQHASAISSYRLLILDGFRSHHTIEFIEFCWRQNIIPFAMPPHLTHLLQPLDVVVFQPYKHYYSKALDQLVHDGLTNITKLEFLSYIQQVRKKAFKYTTILSAFEKTGIWPLNSQFILQTLRERAPVKTPSPEPCEAASSDFETPTTLRQINKVADKLDNVLYEDGTFSPEFNYNLSRFIRGSLIAATELVQTKRDLCRTKKAELVSLQRRASRNKTLKSGGIINIADGRQMVLQKEVNEVDKARKVVEAANKKEQNYAKCVFFEAAKKARK